LNALFARVAAHGTSLDPLLDTEVLCLISTDNKINCFAGILEPSDGLEPSTPSLPSSDDAGTAGTAGKPRARKPRKKKESAEDE
jgi:hypothetical protein